MEDMRANEETFGFGFNDFDFSDRLLHIEITPDHIDQSDCCSAIEVINLHVNSIILAAKSPFFYKLFKSGMIESQCRELTLKITSYEKAALMDVLNFMYRDILSATTRSDLVDVLMVADKLEVKSCMRYCIEFLLKIPMSLESVLSYFEIPSTLREAEVVRPLIDASKQYLVMHFRDFNKFQEDAMILPISALEVVLGYYGLRLDSEDDVFEFILTWAHAHYSNLKERRKIITERLIPLIGFPYMSSSKLKEILSRPDIDRNFDREEISKLVMDALFYKVEALSDQHINASNDLGSTMITALGCLYHDRLLKVNQLQSPRRIMYFDLKKEECNYLYSSRHLFSQSFFLGGRWFYLYAQIWTDEKSSLEHFGLHVFLSTGLDEFTLEVEFAVMKESSKKFEIQVNGETIEFKDKSGWGWHDLFGISLTDLMSNDSDYFIDGILHIRADLTIINSQA